MTLDTSMPAIPNVADDLQSGDERDATAIG